MDNIDFSKVGMKLKQLRTESGYTQEKVSQDLGCTIAFISNIENNRAKLNLRVLLYYASLCNVSIDSLLSAGQSNSPTAKATENFRELQRIFQTFSLEEQEKIIKTLKIWASDNPEKKA